MIVNLSKRPVVRREAYDLYWKFASARQAIFERRLIDSKGPWTEDSILQEFKFCNVYRACDRVSQFLISDVAYAEQDDDAETRLFQIAAFRFFSKPETWGHVKEVLGSAPTIENLRSEAFLDALRSARAHNQTIYTSAFILCATNAYGRVTKHENHVELLRHMFVRESMGKKLLDAKSLRSIFDALKSFPLIGDFMAYQIAIDLNYSAHIRHSENDFTCPGPGALRGIRKAFIDLGGYTSSDIIFWMVENQQKEFERLGLQFGGLYGRPLHAIDCQGLFCELDKYCRVALPDLKSNRSRIKARFAPAPEPPKLFFPPKWGLNDLIPVNSRLKVLPGPDREESGKIL